MPWATAGCKINGEKFGIQNEFFEKNTYDFLLIVSNDRGYQSLNLQENSVLCPESTLVATNRADKQTDTGIQPIPHCVRRVQAELTGVVAADVNKKSHVVVIARPELRR